LAYEPFPERFPTLHGSGLELRALSEEDLPAWFARMMDEESARLAGDPVASSMAQVEEALEYHRGAFRQKAGIRWAIVPASPGNSIGSVGISGLDPEERTADLGAVLGRASWGQGFAGRAAQLVLDYGFSALELRTIRAVVLPENFRSLNGLRRLGFRSGECPEELALPGRPDSVLFTASND